MNTKDPGVKTEDEATVNEVASESNGGGEGDNATATDTAAAEE